MLVLLFACPEAPPPAEVPTAVPAQPAEPPAPPAPPAPGLDPNPKVDAAPGPLAEWVPPRTTPPETAFVIGAVAADVARSWPIEPSVAMPGSYMIGGSTGMTVGDERVHGTVTVGEGGTIERVSLLVAEASCARRRDELTGAFGPPSSTLDDGSTRVDTWRGSRFSIAVTHAPRQCGVGFWSR